LGPSRQQDTLLDECTDVSGFSDNMGLDDPLPGDFDDSGSAEDTNATHLPNDVDDL